MIQFAFGECSECRVPLSLSLVRYLLLLLVVVVLDEIGWMMIIML